MNSERFRSKVTRAARDGFYRLLSVAKDELYDAVRKDAVKAFAVRGVTLDKRFREAKEKAVEESAQTADPSCSTNKSRPDQSGGDRGPSVELDAFGQIVGGPEMTAALERIRKRVSFDVSDECLAEIRRCATSMTGAPQAFTQVGGFGWPEERLDLFLRAYQDAGESFLLDMEFQDGWPDHASITPFWDWGSNRYLALGGGNYMDAVRWEVVPKSGTGKAIESMAAVYLAKREGSKTDGGRVRSVDRIDGPITWLHAQALCDVPRGSRRIIPISGVNFRAWLTGNTGPELDRKRGVNPEYWDVRVSRQRSVGPPVRYVDPEDDEKYEAAGLDGMAWERIDWETLQGGDHRKKLGDAIILDLRERIKDAVSELSRDDGAFPGADWRAMAAQMATIQCRRVVGGVRDFLCTVGPTESGKTALNRLSCVLCGDPATDISLREENKFDQRVAYAARDGASAILFDEVQKAFKESGKAGEREQLLLRLNTTIDADLKFRDPKTYQLDSAILMTGTTIPPKMKQSEELCGRMREYRLRTFAKRDWQQSCGGKIETVRDRRPEIAVLGDIIVSLVFDFCRGCGFDLRLIDKLLDVRRLRDPDSEATIDRAYWQRALFKCWRESMRAAAGLPFDHRFGDEMFIYPARRFRGQRGFINVVSPELNRMFPFLDGLFGRNLEELGEKDDKGWELTAKKRGNIVFGWYNLFEPLMTASNWSAALGIDDVEAKATQNGTRLGVKFACFPDEDHRYWRTHQLPIEDVPDLPPEVLSEFMAEYEARRKAIEDDDKAIGLKSEDAGVF